SDRNLVVALGLGAETPPGSRDPHAPAGADGVGPARPGPPADPCRDRVPRSDQPEQPARLPGPLRRRLPGGPGGNCRRGPGTIVVGLAEDPFPTAPDRYPPLSPGGVGGARREGKPGRTGRAADDGLPGVPGPGRP